jgi:hypothetical protein
MNSGKLFIKQFLLYLSYSYAIFTTELYQSNATALLVVILELPLYGYDIDSTVDVVYIEDDVYNKFSNPSNALLISLIELNTLDASFTTDIEPVQSLPLVNFS